MIDPAEIDVEELIVNLAAPGAQLIVRNWGHDQSTTATAWLGEYPEGHALTFTTSGNSSRKPYVHVQDDGKASLWIASTSFKLPWLELLKVADFLRLPIDVPESGEQVPA